MTRLLFWLASTVVAYTYVGFPLIVMARARLRPRPHRTADITPAVSVIIAAHDEAAAIGPRVDNLLGLDYPADALEVVVASDGSSDATVAEARRREDPRVRVLDLPRVGKAAALNAAVDASSGEILVFSDANTAYAPEAIRALVRSFADPEVGGVAGNQVYLPASAADGTGDPAAATAAGVGERSYWDFDRIVKEAESLGGSVISATGAIYAMRRELFRPVPDGVTDDFVTSTRVVAQGRRLVFEPGAVALEPVAGSSGREYRRKVRIMTRGLRGVAVARELLDPRQFGFYSLQLLTHKLLRRLMAVPLLVIAVVSPALWGHGPMYRLATLGQVAVYGLGALGLALRDRPGGRRPWFAIPAFFCLVNVASLHALANLLTGRRIDRWEPARRTDLAGPDDPPVTTGGDAAEDPAA
jgi:glycosyltransferase involved in cell wall biosynthesis